MPVQEICRVTNYTQLGDKLFSLTMDAPKIAAATSAGQFVQVACGEGNLLRRPISICDYGAGQLRLVFQVKGEGTAWLSERRAGDCLDVLGPLGHGFNFSLLGGNPVFIGGGIGVPPMLASVKQSTLQGKKTTAILGFRNKNAVILEDEFKKCCNTLICTDDGSYARQGFVSDLLREQIDTASAVCACGPRGMLRAIADICEKADVPCFVSMEERMGCGIGACLVCACALKGEKYGHVCKDGPVFDAKEVAW